MPIFEYLCSGCGKRFEAIVYGGKQPECPSCHGSQLEQQLSTFAVGSASASSRTAPCGAPSGACGAGGGGT